MNEKINMGVLSVSAEMDATKFRAGVKQVEQQLDELSDKANASFGRISKVSKGDGTKLKDMRTDIINIKNAFEGVLGALKEIGNNKSLKSSGFDAALKNLTSSTQTKLAGLNADDLGKIRSPKLLQNIGRQYTSALMSARSMLVKEMYAQANKYDKELPSVASDLAKVDSERQKSYDKELSQLDKVFAKEQKNEQAKNTAYNKELVELNKLIGVEERNEQRAQINHEKEMARKAKEREADEAAVNRSRILERFKTIGTSTTANSFFQNAYADSIAKVTDETVREGVETRILNNVLSEEEQKIYKEITIRKKLAQIMEQNSTVAGKFKTVIQGINKVQDGVSNVFTKAISRLKSAAVTYRIVGGVIRQVWNQLKGMFEEAASYVESINLYTIALGEYAEQGSKWASKISTALYLDPKDIMQYTGAFYNLVQGLGVAKDAAYTMSTSLTQLSYDMSSYLNIDVEAAHDKLQSAITGQSRAVASAGIAMQVASLQQLAYSMGIKKSVSEMTQAEKTYLRYIQIMRSTANMQGDLARTIVTPENAVRVLRNQFTLLARAIGNVFIPIIMKAIPYVMALTRILQDLATRIASFLGVKIGWSSSEIDYSGLKLADTYLEGVGDTAGSTAGKVGSAVKKIKDDLGNLASFDELNVITFNDDTTSGSGGTGGVGGVGGGGSVLPQLEEAVSGYDMLTGLTQQFDKQVDNATKNLDKLKKVLTGILAIFAAWKALKFTGDMIALVGKIKAGSTAMGGLGSVAGLLYKTFKGGKGTVGELGKELGETGYQAKHAAKEISEAANATSKLKSILPSILKVIGGVTLSLASMAIEYKNVNKQTIEYLKTGKEMSALVPTLGVIGATAGGALAGSAFGPIGTIVGGTIGAIGSISLAWDSATAAVRKFNLESQIFGSTHIDASTWTSALDSIFASSNQVYNSMKNIDSAMEANYESIGKSLDSLDTLSYKYGVVGTKISTEDTSKIMSTLKNVTTDSITLIEDSTSKSLMLWQSMLNNNNVLTEKEGEKLLSTITRYNNDRKIEIQNAEDNITRTWKNAIDTRGYLTTEERKYIEGELSKIRSIVNEQMTKTQADVIHQTYQFKNDKQKLDKESYAEFNNALDTFASEQKTKRDEMYYQALADAEIYYGKDQEKFENAIKLAEAEYSRSEQETTAKINEYRKTVLSEVGNMYVELLEKTDAESQIARHNLETMFKDLKIDKQWIIDNFADAGSIAYKSASQRFQEMLNKSNVYMTLPVYADTQSFTDKVNSLLKNASKSNIIGPQPQLPVQKMSVKDFAKLHGLAEGGYPDSGDFFFANENGIPEYITSIGNKSAVVNQQQMVTALTNAIVEGLSNMNTPQSNEPVNIYIGNDKVYSGFINYAKRQNNIYGTNVIRI